MTEKNTGKKLNRRTGHGAVFFLFAGIYTELCFHALIFGFAGDGIPFYLFCGAVWGGLLYFIASVSAHRALGITAGIITGIMCFFACVQLVYFRVFGNLMKLSLVGMGGQVFKTFYAIVINTVAHNILQILLLLLPLILIIFSGRIKKLLRVTASAKKRVNPALLVLLISLAAGFVLGNLSAGGRLSAFELYKSAATDLDGGYRLCGLAGGALRDLCFDAAASEDSGYSGTAIIASNLSSGKENKSSANILDIDFEALAASTEDETLKALDNYFASAQPTKTNEYTGLLEDCNIISICAESFSPYLIDEELTPALWKLSHTGLIFENYYGSFQSLTSNGEYTMCTGLYPDMQNTETATCFEASIGHYLPFCLGNSLTENGYRCYAYHSNVGSFYSRSYTHPNMGYEFKSAGDGIDIKPINPSSDLELFEKTVADFTADDTPFHAYYMSWSGHSPYSWDNAMSKKNRETAEALGYSDTVAAYVACNLELEYGLEFLLEYLEENGLADNTAIILTNDHYPYGLTEEEYNELAGCDVDTTFEKYRNSFICYIPWLEESVSVDAYCSTADILPTLLNLLGVDYDSRLLAGRDILSDGPHIAVLGNQSFITDTFRYDAAAGFAPDNEIKDKQGLTEADYASYVSTLLRLSRDILRSDYYSHVFSKSGLVSDSEQYFFDDVTRARHKAAVQYVVESGLMEAESETLFGAEKEAKLSELGTILAKLYGEEISEENAVTWLNEKELCDESCDTALTNALCALILSRCAQQNGIDITIYQNEAKALKEADSELSNELALAFSWASGEAVINKTTDYLTKEKAEPVSRVQLACYISYLCRAL